MKSTERHIIEQLITDYHTMRTRQHEIENHPKHPFSISCPMDLDPESPKTKLRSESEQLNATCNYIQTLLEHHYHLEPDSPLTTETCKDSGTSTPEWLSQALNEGNGVYKP